MNPGLTRRSVLMTGAAAVAFGHTVSDAGAQQPKKGGTLQFAISAETPHYDNHGSDTYATLHFAAPFYSTLLRFDLDKFPDVQADLAGQFVDGVNVIDQAKERRVATKLDREQVWARVEADDELASLSLDRLGETIGEERRTNPFLTGMYSIGNSGRF